MFLAASSLFYFDDMQHTLTEGFSFTVKMFDLLLKILKLWDCSAGRGCDVECSMFFDTTCQSKYVHTANSEVLPC